jgi:hypothetical protein
MTNYANLPISANLPLQMLGTARREGWEDITTHVPDADCDFDQTFIKGEPLNRLVMTVTWAGEGTFKTIKAVKLTTSTSVSKKVELAQEVFNDRNPIVFEGGSQDFLEWAAEDILRSFAPEPD